MKWKEENLENRINNLVKSRFPFYTHTIFRFWKENLIEFVFGEVRVFGEKVGIIYSDPYYPTHMEITWSVWIAREGSDYRIWIEDH